MELDSSDLDSQIRNKQKTVNDYQKTYNEYREDISNMNVISNKILVIDKYYLPFKIYKDN